MEGLTPEIARLFAAKEDRRLTLTPAPCMVFLLAGSKGEGC